MTTEPIPAAWIESANYVRRQLGSMIGMWNALVTGEPVEIIVLGEFDRPIITLPVEKTEVTALAIKWWATLYPGTLDRPERAYGLAYGTATTKRRMLWKSHYGDLMPMTIPTTATWTFNVTCSVDFLASLDVVYEFEEDGVLRRIPVHTALEPGEPIYG